MLLKRGEGNGKITKRNNQRFGNEVTGRARVQVRFCSHLSFSRSRPVLVLRLAVPRFSNIFLKLIFFQLINANISSKYLNRCLAFSDG